MASKRIKTSQINWSAIAERVHPDQQLQFQQFKQKSERYRQILADVKKITNNNNNNNQPLPPIDWSYYKSKISPSNLVDKYQKEYESLNVPYPKDTEQLAITLHAQNEQIKLEIKEFKVNSKDRIVAYQRAIENLESLLPTNEMTMEDFKDAYPEYALDPLNRPTFWPHTYDEQLNGEKEKK